MQKHLLLQYATKAVCKFLPADHKLQSGWIDATLGEILHQALPVRCLQNFRQDIHDEINVNVHITAVHDGAEVFDRKTEAMFRYLQVPTYVGLYHNLDTPARAPHAPEDY